MAVQEARPQIYYPPAQTESVEGELIEQSYNEAATYVAQVTSMLSRFGYWAIVNIDGSTEKLMDGLDKTFGDGNVHDWLADGNVQGKALGTAESEQAVYEIDSFGPDDLLVLHDVDLRGTSGDGTSAIVNSLQTIIDCHTVQGTSYSKEHPNRLPMILAIGSGSLADMPTSDRYNPRDQQGFAAGIPNRYAYTEADGFTTCL